MQAACRHLESSAPGTSLASSSRIGVFSASRHWDAVLGFVAGGDTFDVSFGETFATCFTTSDMRDGRDSRVELRKAATELRERDTNYVLVLCSGQRVGSPSGSLFVVEDHVNRSGDNPLIGMRSSERGERFLDMACAYDPVVRTALHRAARDAGILVERGVAVDEPPMRQPEGVSTSESNARVTGLALPVIAARQAGARVGAVAWLEEEPGSSDETSADAKGYCIEGLRRFLGIATSSIAAHTGV